MKVLPRVARIATVGVQLLVAAVSLYQTSVTLVGYLRRRPRSAGPGTTPSFALLVCARDEEAVVPGILADLGGQRYDGEARVFLVAHNCSDGTALAGRQAGVDVLEVTTAAEGKAAAMRAGMAAVAAFDYVGIFDADSRAPADLLTHVAAAIDGEDCLQVETAPRMHHDWLSTGYGLGRRARNLFWWRPREALGLGTTFSGTGYFIRPALLIELLTNVHTLTEDLELTAQLASRGQRVAYLSSVQVFVEEPHSFSSSLRQRLRWVRGHLAVVRHYALPLAREAARGDVRAGDTLLYLLLPTRVLTRLGVTAAFALSLFGAPWSLPLRLAGIAATGEWLVPATIAVRERLVPLSLGGLNAAVRHTLLGLLWFPIGLWALVTPGNHAWDPMPRAKLGERDVTPVI